MDDEDSQADEHDGDDVPSDDAGGRNQSFIGALVGHIAATKLLKR